MKRSRLLLLPLALAPGAAAQSSAPNDSTVTVRGIVELRTDQTDSAGAWVVFLPVPVVVQDLRTNTIALAGGERLASRFADRYVEVRARVAVERDASGRTLAIANDERIREVRPPGLVQQDVELSLSERATVELAVVPQAAVWVDRAGVPSGVTPTVLFSVVNHSQTELRFFFPTNEVVCVLVRPADGGSAHEVTWKVSARYQLVTLRMGAVFRQMLPIPRTIAAYTGRYLVRAALCGADQLHAEAPFDILAP
ncbi:MAG TPA: hypothetical protein VFI79_13740 [Gemmatimonadales bacterium]|nr:hypothetical protein [Gemmatimonadales bacterium]